MNEILNYIDLRLDIISQNPDRWLGYNKRELPSFEYYLLNKDKLLKRNYKTHAEQTKVIDWFSPYKIERKSKKVMTWVEYSSWMGTPYNFKQVIE